MRVIVVSDHEPTTARVRQLLLREGQDCPPSNAFSLDRALGHSLGGTDPDLLIVVLSPDPERVLACLGTLRLLTQARLAVVGPSQDPQLILQALRAGASDYVDEMELETELLGALDRLESEAHPQRTTGQTVAILGPSGGTGSTTLAANLSLVLAKQHQRVLTIDLKLAGGDLATLLNLKPTHTLAELCQNAARMDRVMLDRSLVVHDSGVHLLAPPRSFMDIDYVTAEGVRQALALARSQFPYVIVDLDHSFRQEQLQVLHQADVILVVFRLDFASLCNCRRTLESFEHLGIHQDRLRLVVNRYGQPQEVPTAKAEEALGTKIAHFLPDDPKAVNRSINNGIPAVLECPSARFSKSVVQLAAALNGEAEVRRQAHNGRVEREQRLFLALPAAFLRQRDEGTQMTRINSNHSFGPAAGPPSAEDRFLQLKKELHQRLIANMDLTTLGKMSEEELRREVRRATEELCRLSPDLLSLSERERLVTEVLDETFGLGPLEPLLSDPTISDILVNGPKTVYLERQGRLEQADVAFNDDRHLLQIIQRIVSRVGRRVDETSPMVDARLPDGSRVNAVIPPLAVDGALLSIRRFGSRPLLIADLLAKGSIAQEIVQFLMACVKARISLLISGGTGSGKTTLLNALSAFIPASERIVTIEDAAELRLQQPHVVRMETRPPNIEGVGEVPTRDLVRNALRNAPGSHHRRRVPRSGSAGHAPGHEHRP